jgi:phospholipase/carboxylesterase
MRITRRRFGAMAGGAWVSLTSATCASLSESFATGDGRLTARPRIGVTTTGDGTHALGLDRDRDAILQLPANVPPTPLPLIVLLHGATGNGQGILRRVGAAAGDAGIAVLAPDSRNGTWDAIRQGFGPDVTFIDRALERVFNTVSVDPARMAIGGFSDGATYAIALGLINGDLFRRVVAFSPGFIVPGEPHGKPEFFVSHGTNDRILPIDETSRVIVPTLQRHGYTVTFREFDGVHEVPAAIAAEGLRWVAATKPA